jgi:hypothetical protein
MLENFRDYKITRNLNTCMHAETLILLTNHYISMHEVFKVVVMVKSQSILRLEVKL